MLGDAPLAARLGRAGRVLVRDEGSLEAMVLGYETLIANILNAKAEIKGQPLWERPAPAEILTADSPGRWTRERLACRCSESANLAATPLELSAPLARNPISQFHPIALNVYHFHETCIPESKGCPMSRHEALKELKNVLVTRRDALRSALKGDLSALRALSRASGGLGRFCTGFRLRRNFQPHGRGRMRRAGAYRRGDRADHSGALW